MLTSIMVIELNNFRLIGVPQISDKDHLQIVRFNKLRKMSEPKLDPIV